MWDSGDMKRGSELGFDDSFDDFDDKGRRPVLITDRRALV